MESSGLDWKMHLKYRILKTGGVLKGPRHPFLLPMQVTLLAEEGDKIETINAFFRNGDECEIELLLALIEPIELY